MQETKVLCSDLVMLKYWDLDKRERWREGYSEGGKLFSPSLSTPASKAGLVSRLLEERMEENEGGGSRERGALPVFHLTCRGRQGVKRRGKKTSLPEVGVASLTVSSAAASKVTPF